MRADEKLPRHDTEAIKDAPETIYGIEEEKKQLT